MGKPDKSRTELLSRIRDLEQRLRQAEDALRAIRSGEVDALVVSGSQGDQIYTLQGADHPYRILVESIQEGALTLTPEGLILYCNQQFAGMVKAPLERVIGAQVQGFVAPDQRDTFQALLQAVSAGASKGEVTFQAEDGSRMPAYLSLSSLETGGVRSVCMVAANLSERIAQLYREAQQELERRKQLELELRRSNQDLQDFAFVISHDLQAPVKAMVSLAQLLEQDCRGTLPADAQVCLGHIMDAGSRAQSMVAGLLRYSRMAHDTFGFDTVNLQEVVRWAEQNLEKKVLETQATITHDPLPTVSGDFGRLAQVFQNLIENAMKYRRDEPPRVHISAEQKGAEWLLCVSDNGIGIDPRYTERVFVMFKRLHGSDYEGTGIGLAVCKKIVERHGGHIWVESESGEGSRFYFTLPAVAVSGTGERGHGQAA
jgi:PAS domain S-box-containing protein